MAAFRQPPAAFAIGLLFGVGLTVAQMTNPAKVLAFLDLAGAWDPSLALVMGAALLVSGLGFRLVWRRRQPLFGGRFQVPSRDDLELRLFGGAALFGVGWGLAGYCPGPALAGLTLGGPRAWLFVAAMLTGMLLFELVERVHARVHARAGGR